MCFDFPCLCKVKCFCISLRGGCTTFSGAKNCFPLVCVVLLLLPIPGPAPNPTEDPRKGWVFGDQGRCREWGGKEGKAKGTEGCNTLALLKQPGRKQVFFFWRTFQVRVIDFVACHLLAFIHFTDSWFILLASPWLKYRALWAERWPRARYSDVRVLLCRSGGSSILPQLPLNSAMLNCPLPLVCHQIASQMIQNITVTVHTCLGP